VIVPVNPLFRSYTKLQLRYLVIDPEYDLTKLDAPLPPTDIKPMSAKSLLKNVKLLISRGHMSCQMTIDHFLDPRYTRAHLPACWCHDILKHMIG
jgi:hypothetical protein